MSTSRLIFGIYPFSAAGMEAGVAGHQITWSISSDYCKSFREMSTPSFLDHISCMQEQTQLHKFWLK